MALQEDEFDDYVDYVEDEPAPAGGSRRLLIIVLSVGCVALAISNVVLAMRVTQLRRAPAVERSPSPEEAATAPTPTTPMTESAAAEPPLTAPSVAAPPSSQASSPAAAAMPPSSTAAPSSSDVPPAPERTVVARKPSAAKKIAPRRETSEPPAASVTTPAPAEPATRPRREVAAPAPERAPSPDLPARRSPREEARVAAVTRATERIAPAPPISERATPERATATWMVQEYGRADAERRARAVADFYGAHSPDGVYWRHVLAEIAGRP
jgi:hypothetical protein